MKKVSLLNKKIISTGISASLLLSQLGSTSVFAEKVDAQTQTVYRDVGTQTEINDILNNNEDGKETLVIDDSKKIAVQPSEKEDSIEEVKIEEDKETIEKENEKSKKEIAEKIAKYVAAAAITGTVVYLGYRYRAPIMENLMTAGQHISNGTKNAWRDLSKTTATHYSNAVKGTKSLWNSATSKVATGYGKVQNTTQSIWNSSVNTVKNFFCKGTNEPNSPIVENQTIYANKTLGEPYNDMDELHSIPNARKETVLRVRKPTSDVSNKTDVCVLEPTLNANKGAALRVLESTSDVSKGTAVCALKPTSNGCKETSKDQGAEKGSSIKDAIINFFVSGFKPIDMRSKRRWR